MNRKSFALIPAILLVLFTIWTGSIFFTYRHTPELRDAKLWPVMLGFYILLTVFLMVRSIFPEKNSS